MIDSNTILYVIIIFSAFTLYYTYQNDFGVFLLTVLLILSAFWCYLFIDEFKNKWENKFDNVKKSVEDKVDFLANKLFNVSNQFVQKFQQ